MSMNWFDCNCSYGKISRPALRFAATPQALLEEMNICGIDKALVFHGCQQISSPVTWNPRLIEEVRGESRLSPTWAILPPSTGELLPPDLFFESMKAAGVRALWAFPQEHRFRLDGVSFESLFKGMIERRIPLFAKQNLLDLKELLVECPDLRVVAVNQGPHSMERFLRPLLDKFPNLYLETSGLIVDGLLEEFCERYGCERLLFGSGFPGNPPGAALMRVAHADLDETTRMAVAGGNLTRLLGEVQL